MTSADERYSRQQRLPQIGSAGQEALGQSKVALVGLGALGSTTADLLARSGVGSLKLIDRDLVDWSNLQRQSLYTEEDARTHAPKAHAAAQRLQMVNSQISVSSHCEDLQASNIHDLFDGVNLIMDGTDNFAVRYLINDFSVQKGIPYVYAGAVGTYGMTGAVLPQRPCLRCTWPEPPDSSQAPTCRSAGVLGPIVNFIASAATAEGLKILLGADEKVFPGYRWFDLWNSESRPLRTQTDPSCPCCQGKIFPWLDNQEGPQTIGLCGSDTVQITSTQPFNLSVLTDQLTGKVEGLEHHTGFLRVHERGLEFFCFPNGRLIIRGTEDLTRARSAAADLLGI